MEAIVEKALSRLRLQFAWEDEELFILDSQSITGEDLHVHGLVRPGSLQLSVPLLSNPSPEQTGVAFWQEWRRRGEATFCMVDEQEELRLAVRLPLYEMGPKELAASLRAGLLALARSFQKRQDLFHDVQKEEEREAIS